MHIRTAPGRAGGLLITGILLVGLTSAPAIAMAGDVPGTARINLDSNGRLSVAITAGTDLAAVLSEIGRVADVKLRVHGDLGTVAPRGFSGVPLDEGIRRLAGRHSLVMVYRGFRTRSTMESAGPNLREVRVYQHRKAAEMAAQAAPMAMRLTELPRDQVESRAVMQRRIIELSYKRDATALEELRQLLASAEDARLRRDAVNALASIASAEALDALGRVGLSDEDPRVRVAAAQGLWRARGMVARPALIQALAKEQDVSARKELEAMLNGGRSRIVEGQTRKVRRETAAVR